MELSIIIPTRDRRGILLETLARLESQADGGDWEAIVVDDGSSDGTADAVRARTADSPLEVQVLEQAGLGPAAARNRALEHARAPVCLFMDDDSLPRPRLFARHRDFHAGDPAPEAALLGSVVLPTDPAPTAFVRFLQELMFDYAISDPRNAGGQRFYACNVSAKKRFVMAAGSFDARLALAAHEDIDLGLRLEARGMRLAYDAEAIVEHVPPLDLRAAVARMWRTGQAQAGFVAKHPDWAVASPPGARHRAKAAALTALAALGVRTPRVQREIWRFLCHQATREGYWSAVENGVQSRAPADGVPRIGRRLVELASRDPEAQAPVGAPQRATARPTAR
jgi:GT2 family glycosyltransferase